jgi:hypothetical protein
MPPRTRRTGELALVILAAAVLTTTAACAGTPPAADAPGTPPPRSSSSAPRTPADTPTSPPARPPSASPSQEADTVTTIRITVGGETVTGELNDTPTAQDLARQLPLTITLDDLNGVEKVGELPRPLTMDGVPAGADPEINDIGYYRPSNGLVFYYGDVGYFNGIVRLGRLPETTTQLIRRQAGTFTITIDEA